MSRTIGDVIGAFPPERQDKIEERYCELKEQVMSDWKPTKDENPNFRCKCGSNEVEYYLWESSCGGYEDYHYRCKDCSRDWWVESADA